MQVKFDAQVVFQAAFSNHLTREELNDIVGFMVGDFIERLEPFRDYVETDVTDRMVEGIEIKAKCKAGKPKTCTNVYETARRRTAGENIVCTDKAEPKKRGRKPKTATQE